MGRATRTTQRQLHQERFARSGTVLSVLAKAEAESGRVSRTRLRGRGLIDRTYGETGLVLLILVWAVGAMSSVRGATPCDVCGCAYVCALCGPCVCVCLSSWPGAGLELARVLSRVLARSPHKTHGAHRARSGPRLSWGRTGVVEGKMCEISCVVAAQAAACLRPHPAASWSKR